MSVVVCKDLIKRFGDSLAVDHVNVEIPDGEFMVFVGPSGCGKTTTLRMIAGLESVSDGEIRIDGKLMNDVAPRHRDIAMVFQNYALVPALQGVRQYRLSAQAAAGAAGRDRPPGDARPPGCWTSSGCSTAGRASSRAASGSGSRWAGPSCASLAFT